MAIATVRVQLQGVWYPATYNSSTGKWEVTVTAPGTTSFHEPGGFFPVTAEATNQAGTTTAVDTSDPVVGDDLRLVVRERVAPVVTITSPSNGAYLPTAQPEIIFTLRDEPGGSGIDLDALALDIDGTEYGADAAGMALTPVEGGYDGTFTPPSLPNGPHTIILAAADHDGNDSNVATVTFTVDTQPPALNVTSPLDGLITAEPEQTVAGTTNDEHSPEVTVTITLNGADQGAVAVQADGSFAKPVTLAEGGNTIVVTATDTAGTSTTITHAVTLDTSEPTFTGISITPNPADAGATLIISVEVE